jgi:hypothetical protein
MITLWGKIENGEVVLVNNQEKQEWLERNRNYKGNLLCKISKTTRERTTDQNRALHLWLEKKAEQCRDAGVTAQMAFSKTIELEITPEIMKEIWRQVQNAMFQNGKSTKNLEKNGQIEEVYEHINRFFAEKFNLEGIEFPTDNNKITN